ncbi:MAG: hypothetical protein ACI4F3_06130, partial [Enterocloster sp.]
YGVTYSISEAKYDGYTPEYGYEDTDTDAQEQKIDSASEKATVTNTKEGQVDTGIILDNMPYILILAVVAIGAVGFVSKKRSSEF